MKRLFVAVPTTGNICDAQVYALRKITEKYRGRVELVYPEQCVRRVFHDFARNAMVEEFLASDCDAMWFLDSDVSPPDHVLDLVADHWDKWLAAGCPYPLFMSPEKGAPQQVVMGVYNGSSDKGLCPSKVPYSGTDFVDGLATGCMFLKRELFAELQKPYFEFKYGSEDRHPAEGEDIGFCKKVNALGYKFLVDYSAVCKHYKTVCLLDVNNYAIGYANTAVLAYDKLIRSQFEQLRSALSKKNSQRN